MSIFFTKKLQQYIQHKIQSADMQQRLRTINKPRPHLMQA